MDSTTDTPSSSQYAHSQTQSDDQASAQKGRTARPRGEQENGGAEIYGEWDESGYDEQVQEEGRREVRVSAAPGMNESRGITEDDRNAFAETVMYFERRITHVS